MSLIITIGRQFGSGGRDVGEKVAEYFNIPFYDKELESNVIPFWSSAFTVIAEKIEMIIDKAQINDINFLLFIIIYSFCLNKANYIK